MVQEAEQRRRERKTMTEGVSTLYYLSTLKT